MKMIWIRRTLMVYGSSLGIAFGLIPVLSNKPQLQPYGMALAGLLIISALYTARKLYRSTSRGEDICVGSIAMLLFCDMIAIASTAFLFTVGLDALWILLSGHKTLLGLEPDWIGGTRITGLHFVTLPGLLIAVPFFTFFTTAKFDQKLTFTDEGLGSTGVFRGKVLLWQDIHDLKVVEAHSVAQLAAHDYKTLEKNLQLETQYSNLTIHQPTSKRKKAAILEKIEAHLGSDLEEKIAVAKKRW